MKQILLLVCLHLVAGTLSAQTEKYYGAMGKQLAALGEAKEAAAMQDVMNGFERIAKAEKNQWLPYYYAGLSQVWHAFMLNNPAQFDALADRAEAFATAAAALDPGNSEIVMLQAMILTLRMAADPMTRYMQYGTRINTLIEQSKSLDPNNPRPLMWQAQSLLQTPEQFGGGCKTAAPLFEAALERYTRFQPATPLHPVWGKPQTEQLLGTCK